MVGARPKPTKFGNKIDNMKNKIRCIDMMRDFEYLIKKICEFDNLTRILLNEHQALALRQIATKIDMTDFVDTHEMKEDKLVNYFCNLLTSDPLSGYDEMLFAKLDNKLKERIFNKLNSTELQKTKEINDK